MNPESRTRIETTLPKAWEEDETFHDVLYDWMSRAPWLLVSGALHFVVFLIVAAIPWHLFERPEETVIDTALAPPPEPEVVDPPEEPEVEIEAEETEEEPILEDYEVSDHTETDTNEEFMESDGDPELASDSPFDQEAINSVLGIGGPAGGKYGGRFGGSRNLRGPGGSGTEVALRAGLEWLQRHQDEDGKWDSDEFMKHDPADDPCTGPGDPNHDVGNTGLALLAFLGDGHTMRRGLYKDVVSAGMKWLRNQQDPETGLLGEQIGHAYLYDHSIATLALSEAYYFDKSPLLRTTAQRSINLITRARNPYGAWRYDYPPTGDSDTSVTGWMIFALKSAEEGGLRIDKEAFVGGMNWLDEMTDPGTGRCGYDEAGSSSSRVEGINDEYPEDSGEAMTAVALLCRFFLGQDPKEDAVMQQHAELLRKSLPEWDPQQKANDMYYWYYGSYAMYQMGGRHWTEWNRAMKPAVLGSQRKDGAHDGSWDPIGPWGYAGGRVYSTALMVLCLEVYFRYAQVLGGR